MKKLKWFFGAFLVGLVAIAMYVSCGHEQVEPTYEHRDSVVLEIDGVLTNIIVLTEDEEVPSHIPQGACDSVSGISYHVPSVPLDSVTNGIVYNATAGQALLTWYGVFSGPFEALASILGGDFCDTTLETMGTLVISGYYDSPTELENTYWIIVYTETNDDPYGLLLGQ